MPKLTTFLVLLLFFSLGTLTAQETFRQFVPAANEVSLADGTEVTWSLGDLFADDLTGVQIIITSQSEQQLAHLYGLRLLGNPTAAITRLELTDPLPISYQLYDLQGRVLLTQDAGRAMRHDIDLGMLPAQTYLLSVFTTEGKRLLATYRIQKL
ncbi:T9SS type A sorting domain-containing protein [Neolewinella persica]|uniref:T9SS type A sorting domain-containing protein n=1 Tax=Neolewinella persica TaxID=70998 RepID=UPI000370F537|nr:T9SS type A sorting domain-containing protein [Neolewinella persica]